MSPNEVRKMQDREIVEMLLELKPSDEAVGWLATVLADDGAFEGVRELRRRFTDGRVPASFPVTATGRQRSANTVSIDSDRFKALFYRRRIPLNQIGPMMEPPRSGAWASVICNKGTAGFYALDALATSLCITVDDLIFEVGTSAELARANA